MNIGNELVLPSDASEVRVVVAIFSVFYVIFYYYYCSRLLLGYKLNTFYFTKCKQL